MQSGKLFVGLACACLLLISVVPSSATSISILGNSGHGQNDGVGSWNISSQLGTTTVLPYNASFPGFQSAPVVSLGGGVYEQVACTNNSACALGDTSSSATVEFLFLIPTSQIQGNTITFGNVNFSLLQGVESLSCDGPNVGNFGSNSGPGYLCSSYGSGVDLTQFTFTPCPTTGGTCPQSGTGQLTLTFSGSFAALCNGAPTTCSVTLGFIYSNQTLNGPTLGGITTPEPTSILLLATGLVASGLRRRFWKT